MLIPELSSGRSRSLAIAWRWSPRASRRARSKRFDKHPPGSQRRRVNPKHGRQCHSQVSRRAALIVFSGQEWPACQNQGHLCIVCKWRPVCGPTLHRARQSKGQRHNIQVRTPARRAIRERHLPSRQPQASAGLRAGARMRPPCQLGPWSVKRAPILHQI